MIVLTLDYDDIYPLLSAVIAKAAEEDVGKAMVFDSQVRYYEVTIADIIKRNLGFVVFVKLLIVETRIDYKFVFADEDDMLLFQLRYVQ